MQKAELRQIAKARLANNAPLRRPKSTQIWQRLETLDVFQQAVAKDKLMAYLDFQHEVETTRFIKPGRGIVVPCCEGEQIIPILTALDELETGRFGILEPRKEIRHNPKRQFLPDDLAVVLVPGLAFDACGNRLGRGKGFYDRLLSTLSPETVSIGLAFECQIFEHIPTEPEDVSVDFIVTEDRMISAEVSPSP